MAIWMRVVAAVVLAVIVVPVLCSALQTRDSSRFGEKSRPKRTTSKEAPLPKKKKAPALAPESPTEKAENWAAQQEPGSRHSR